MSDEKLRDLADALAREANTTSCSSQLLLLHRRTAYTTNTTERQGRMIPWNAVARASIRPQWPPPLSVPLTAASAEPEVGPGKGKLLTCFGNGGGIRLLRRWNGLRMPVPCKHLLSAGCGGGGSGGSGGGGVHVKDRNHAPVTCLTYLPLAMLLVSGYADGRVRLWDPCARRHKLAPPPPPSLGTECGRDRREKSGEGSRGASGQYRGRGKHLRLSPGSYAKAAEEWTEKGQTFGCVATFGAVPTTALTPGGKRDGGGAGGDVGGFLRVRAVDSVVFSGVCATSLVVCDPELVRVAQAMDAEEPWNPASAGEIGRGVHTLTLSQAANM